MSSIGKKIAHHMKEKGWSIPTTSEKSGVPATTIKSILYGRSVTQRLSTLEKLAKVFDCSIDDLISEDSDKTAENKELDKKLFQECLDAVELYLKEQNLNYEKGRVMKIIESLFSLLLKKKKQNISYEIDSATIEWIIDNIK